MLQIFIKVVASVIFVNFSFITGNIILPSTLVQCWCIDKITGYFVNTVQGHKLPRIHIKPAAVSMSSTHPKVCGILVPVHKIFKRNCAVGNKVIWRYCSIVEHRDPQTEALYPVSHHSIYIMLYYCYIHVEGLIPMWVITWCHCQKIHIPIRIILVMSDKFSCSEQDLMNDCLK